jgi:hypothetical protein
MFMSETFSVKERAAAEGVAGASGNGEVVTVLPAPGGGVFDACSCGGVLVWAQDFRKGLQHPVPRFLKIENDFNEGGDNGLLEQ